MRRLGRILLATVLVQGTGAVGRSEGIAGGPPPDDGRAAYLARPWAEVVARDADICAYEVHVEGHRVPLHVADVDNADWGGEYYFGSFPVDRPVRVRVRTQVSLLNVKLQPVRPDVTLTVLGEHEVEIVVLRPMRLTLEPDGRRRPLMLFADPPERDVPSPGQENVIWFGPGCHQAGKIVLGSNQTLYLAPGAVVSGGVEVRGTNVTVRGRGILDGRAYRRFCGPTPWMFDFVGCRDVRVEGVICRNPFNWVLSFLDCEDVTVENFKLCGGRMINDDAVDICNCRRFTLRNSFFRCTDDVFAIKGNLPFGAKMTPVDDVLIEDCEAWTDGANVFRVGFECNASYFRNVRARRIEVLHAAANYRDVAEDWANCVFYLQPANGMLMENLLFEDIRVRAEGPLALFSAYSRSWGCRGRSYDTAGRLRNVTVRNVSVVGATRVQVLLRGHSDSLSVDGVTFENVTVNGVRLTRTSPDVTMGSYVRDVQL